MRRRCACPTWQATGNWQALGGQVWAASAEHCAASKLRRQQQLHRAPARPRHRQAFERKISMVISDCFDSENRKIDQKDPTITLFAIKIITNRFRFKSTHQTILFPSGSRITSYTALICPPCPNGTCRRQIRQLMKPVITESASPRRGWTDVALTQTQ